MAIWLQKLVLTVVAIVPVIAGEIVRLTDCCAAPKTSIVAPGRAVAPPALEAPGLWPVPPSAWDPQGDVTVRGC